MAFDVNVSIQVFSCPRCGFLYGVIATMNDHRCPKCLEREYYDKCTKYRKLFDKLSIKSGVITRLKNTNKKLKKEKLNFK